MFRKISLAAVLAAALAPAAASARAVPDAKPHCTECLTRVTGGGAASYRRLPEARSIPAAQVRTGVAQPSRRNVQAPPAVGGAPLVARPGTPCTRDCCRHERA